MTAIHLAVRKNDLQEVTQLLAAGTDIETHDEAGQTPLMTACLSADASLEMVNLLLDHGANPNGLTRVESHDYPKLTDMADVDPLAALQDIPELAGLIDNMPEVLKSLHEMQDQLKKTEPERSSVLSIAVKSAGLEKLQALIEHGADLHYRSAAGYTAMLHAACCKRMEVIGWLLAAGASPDGETTYRESVLSVLSRMGEFGQIAKLLEWGADPAPLEWTPLHRAAAMGTSAEIAMLLDQGAELEPVDFWERTPLLLAIHAENIENASLLLERGANRSATGRCGKTAMHYPIDRDDVVMLEWLLAQGFPADAMDDFKSTPLMHAVESSAPGCFKKLLDVGVEWRRTNHYGETLIANATHPEIISRLIELGDSLENLEDEVLRDWIGLGNHDELPVTKAEFHSGRSRRYGTANPELMNVSFWNAMVRNGWNAWKAANHFGHDSYGLDDPVWCHHRFGMSLTALPDGRWVQISGEHEDGYDPDFCIYNDVIVHDGHGGFQIYGYPKEVFPPTDFHSATLVGEWIYIIGNLGYPEMREASGYETPVFRLHTGDWHIEKVETHGESPGWIHKHQAKLDGDSIRVFQGMRYFVTDKGKEKFQGLTGSYELNLTSGTWNRR